MQKSKHMEIQSDWKETGEKLYSKSIKYQRKLRKQTHQVLNQTEYDILEEGLNDEIISKRVR